MQDALENVDRHFDVEFRRELDGVFPALLAAAVILRFLSALWDIATIRVFRLRQKLMHMHMIQLPVDLELIMPAKCPCIMVGRVLPFGLEGVPRDIGKLLGAGELRDVVDQTLEVRLRVVQLDMPTLALSARVLLHLLVQVLAVDYQHGLLGGLLLVLGVEVGREGLL